MASPPSTAPSTTPDPWLDVDPSAVLTRLGPLDVEVRNRPVTDLLRLRTRRSCEAVDTTTLRTPTHDYVVSVCPVVRSDVASCQRLSQHWRDRNGAEVDLIVEDDSGSIAGVEVKAASTVSPADVKHLQGLRDKLGDRFSAGVVLYLGDRVVPLGERIWAFPVSTLWAD